MSSLHISQPECKLKTKLANECCLVYGISSIPRSTGIQLAGTSASTRACCRSGDDERTQATEAILALPSSPGHLGATIDTWIPWIVLSVDLSPRRPFASTIYLRTTTRGWKWSSLREARRLQSLENRLERERRPAQRARRPSGGRARQCQKRRWEDVTRQAVP